MVPYWKLRVPSTIAQRVGARDAPSADCAEFNHNLMLRSDISALTGGGGVLV